MIPVLSVKTMRDSDAATIRSGISGNELMKKAGEGIVRAAGLKSPVAIVCGKGNNAGDGFAAALLLKKEKIECSIFLLCEEFSESGKYYFDQCAVQGIPVLNFDEDTSFDGYNTILDCIFGTGFWGKPEGKFAKAILAINASKAYVVSADINSGLGGDSGMAELCVKSDLTVSVGFFQPGHLLNMAGDVMKKKTNIDIGIKPLEITAKVIEKEDLKAVFPKRPHLSNKSNYGYVGLLGGSECYSGAIRLAGLANCAMRSGAGVAVIAAPRCICNIVSQNVLESTLFPLTDTDGHIKFVPEEMDRLMRRVRVLAFGMGISLNEETEKALRYLMENYTGTLIIDADGITSLSKLDSALMDQAKCKIILTPHNMEFSRLTGLPIPEILEDPVRHAKEYARKHHVTLLLKGPATLVTDGTEVLLTDAGCPGMATAGSGDVLSGILCAICGFQENPVLAAAAAAYINGKAGELAENRSNAYSMTAGDTAGCVKDVLSAIIKD